MGYVGNSPAEKYTTIDKQVITGNGTVGPYTLTHSVGNEQEIEVFVNNVRQEPGVAYTVSANQLTMGGTVAAADDFYIVFQGKAKMTATHPPTFDLNAANGTFTGDLTVDTNTLYVDSTNNRVGVGTSSPNQKLHVYDSSTNATHIRTTNSNGDIFYGLDVNGAGYAWMNSGSGSFYVGTNGAGELIAYAGSAERMRINSTGNVGIGTSSPSVNFHVKNASGNLEIRFDSDNARNIVFADNNGTYDAQIEAQANGTLYIATRQAQPMLFAINNSEKVRIESDGAVVINNSGGDAQLYLGGTSGTSRMYLARTGLDSLLWNVSNGNMRFGTNNDEKMRIDSSGNLLVGTTSAPSTLISATSGGGIALDPDSFSAWNREATSSTHSHLVLNQTGVDAQYLQFRKDGTQVGDIGVNNGDNLRIQGNSSHSGIEFGTNAIFPHKNGSNVDAAIDLGESGLRWKDLYLSGGVYLGGTGSANHLDDYEEGTFNPTFIRSGTAPVYGTSVADGFYRKIGSVVHIQILIVVNSVTTSGSGNLRITGLPFANGVTTYSGVLNVGYNDTFDAAIKDCYVTGGILQFIPTGITQSNYTGVLSTGYCGITGTYITS